MLPEMLSCNEFVNADEIAKGLSPFQPEKVSFQAGRIMLDRINELLKQKINFAFETTLTTLSYQSVIKAAQKKGYKINLLFFWLNDEKLAIERVKIRVKEGGHDIPEDVIIRRYHKGIKNLLRIFVLLCDYWLVIDNSNNPYKLVCEGTKTNQPKIFDTSLWSKIQKQSK